jgi:hypothetical protein
MVSTASKNMLLAVAFGMVTSIMSHVWDKKSEKGKE